MQQEFWDRKKRSVYINESTIKLAQGFCRCEG